MKATFLKLAKSYISAIKSEIEVTTNESESIDEGINIALKNGYWQINNKPLIKCSIVKQNLFDQYMNMKLIKSPISSENSFKHKANEVKRKFNHTFKMREQDFIGDYPNVENVEFVKA